MILPAVSVIYQITYLFIHFKDMMQKLIFLKEFPCLFLKEHNFVVDYKALRKIRNPFRDPDHFTMSRLAAVFRESYIN